HAFVAVELADEKNQGLRRPADTGTETTRGGGEWGISRAKDDVDAIRWDAEPLELLRLHLRQREHGVRRPGDLEPALVSIAAPPGMVIRGQHEGNAPATSDRERGMSKELAADPVVVDQLVFRVHRLLHVRNHLGGDPLC